MPTYDYECDNGHQFEAFQSMKEDPLVHCVQCGANVRRRIGPGAGFIFKGGGFYQTEYRSKDYQEKAKAETSSGGTSSDTTKSSESAASSKESGTKTDSSSSTAKKDTSSGGSSGGGTEKS